MEEICIKEVDLKDSELVNIVQDIDTPNQMEIKKEKWSIEEEDSLINGYGLYLVYSNWTLKDIKLFIENFIPKEEQNMKDKYIGPIRIDYIRGLESERTLCLLHISIYEALLKEGFDKKVFTYDFRVQKYEIRDNNKPGEGFSSNLYIPLPTALNRDDCKNDLASKLRNLELYNILLPGSYRITLPVISRRTGESTGSAFIEFTTEVELKNRAITRLILNDTDWEIKGTMRKYRVKCLWARDRENRNKPMLYKNNYNSNRQSYNRNIDQRSHPQSAPILILRRDQRRLNNCIPQIVSQSYRNNNIQFSPIGSQLSDNPLSKEITKQPTEQISSPNNYGTSPILVGPLNDNLDMGTKTTLTVTTTISSSPGNSLSISPINHTINSNIYSSHYPDGNSEGIEEGPCGNENIELNKEDVDYNSMSIITE